MAVAILLAAVAVLRHLRIDLSLPVATILERTLISRSRAYELRDALLEIAPSILRPRGRPPQPAPVISDEAIGTLYALRGEVLTFLAENPGAVHAGPKRQRYSDDFRRFVIRLRTQHEAIQLARFAEAVRVPLETLEEWLRVSPTSPPASAQTDASPAADELDPAKSRTLETILAVWKTWRGSFTAFCEHLHTAWRIEEGRTFIAEVLELHGERAPRRRPGRTPDEVATRDTIETFFSGALWVADGSQLSVVIDDLRYDLNLELTNDAHSAAVLGAVVSKEEDEKALLDSFEDAINTADGATPLALLLDNKPSNHSDNVIETLDGLTIRIRATPYRPQNKAHVEGAFGLFKTDLPPLVFSTKEPLQLAQQILRVVVTIWARMINQRPRSDRQGRSRADLYADKPTAEQIEHARAALTERARKQELARETRLARTDPVIRKLLSDAFARLELCDPEDHFKSALAPYARDILAAAIAIFTAKRESHTLPTGADARYLLGIVRNLAAQREEVALAKQILDERIRWRDAALAPLFATLDTLRAAHPVLEDRLVHLTRRILDASSLIDEHYFTHALAEEIRARPAVEHQRLLDLVARLTAASFTASPRRRQELILAVAERLCPLA